MLKKYFIIGFIFIIANMEVFAQEQVNPEKKTYTAPNGRFYINQQLPVYFRLFTSENPNSPSYLLKSEVTPEMVNPATFRVEGPNTIKITTYIDPSSKSQKPVNLDVYVDGSAPQSKAVTSGVVPYVFGSDSIFGPGLKIELTAKDAYSGVDKIYYSINGEGYKVYANSTIDFSAEGKYVLKFYSVDNVGNVEKPRVIKFTIDVTPPKTTLKINGVRVGDAISNSSSFTLSALDVGSNIKNTYYKFDNAEFCTYSATITPSSLKDGEHTLTFYSMDNVGNAENKANPENKLTFVLDRTAPELEVKLEGEQYKAPGDMLFISNNTKVIANTKDNLVGVETFAYSINGEPEKPYTEPLQFANKGQYSVSVNSMDKLGNQKKKSISFYVDNGTPNTGIKLGKPQVFANDNLNIKSESEITLFTTNYDSGIRETKYTIDGEEPIVYKAPIKLTKEGLHTIKYWSINNVNGIEKQKTTKVVVDNSAPTINYKFSTEPTKKEDTNGKMVNCLPKGSRFFLDVKDNYSGVKSITFSINGMTAKDYKQVSDEEWTTLFNQEIIYNVKVSSTDFLDNSSTISFDFLITK